MTDTPMAYVLCTLCGAVGTAVMDTTPEGHATAMAWAVHFATRHPDAPDPITQFMIVDSAPLL